MIGGEDEEARGICGSGLIDIVAQLRLVGLLDDGELLEVQELYAPNIVVGFGRLDGRSVGIVANIIVDVLYGVVDPRVRLS